MKRTKTLIVAAAISLTSLIPRTPFIPFTSISVTDAGKVKNLGGEIGSNAGPKGNKL